MLAIAFSGPDLHVSVNSSFGWKPLGRVMTITRMKDPFTVQSIDNRPAVEIYQTYLGLAMDEDILTEMLTFPLFLHRNGIALARLPQTSERDGFDVAGRMGGDEFLVILYRTEEREARFIADRIRKHIESLSPLPGGRKMTTSIGTAALLRGDTAQDLYKRADEALYAAKQSGKNAVATARRKS